MSTPKLQDRLKALKEEIEGARSGVIPFSRACLITVSLFLVLALLTRGNLLDPNRRADADEQFRQLARAELDTDEKTVVVQLIRTLDVQSLKRISEENKSSWQRWKEGSYYLIAERVLWLNQLPWGAVAAGPYLRIGGSMLLDTVTNWSADGNEPDSWMLSASLAITNVLLRIVFITLAFWPLWITGLVVGLFVLPKKLRPTPTKDLLGICTRGLGPFYSGIYGPLKPNGAMSGSNYSCPSLACPAQVSEQEASSHELTKLLKEYSATNATNSDLIRVILAYKDFPTFVEEERAADVEIPEEEEQPTISPFAKGIISNELGTIEEASLLGLEAICSANVRLQDYFKQHPSDSYDEIANAKQMLVEGLSPLAATLIESLTPLRAQAIAQCSTALLASAYLACEAGKSLVFKRISKGFSQISRFPHLQARAVIQSFSNYHEEYQGDDRLIIRQAIICSRRHGDFGRAFLPYNMPIASRAIRDLLEILYSHPKRRDINSSLVELDGHLDELGNILRDSLSERLANAEPIDRSDGYHWWKGAAYKSVVLMPLENLLGTALEGVTDLRLGRIARLIDKTRKLQTEFSISARLPGFKRQALEAEQGDSLRGKILDLLKDAPQANRLVDQWFIIRRVLTRHNWLSTRVGDYNVPPEGLVQGVVEDRALRTRRKISFSALVPLRQRRYQEALGANWERTYFYDNPHPDDIEVYVDLEEFNKVAGKLDEHQPIRRAAETTK